MRFKTVLHRRPMPGLPSPRRFAVVADLHDRPDTAELLAELRGAKPDAILLPGDYFHKPGETEHACRFLRACAKICPTVCSVGNHEARTAPIPRLRAAVERCGARLLDNETATVAGVCVGGLSSGYRFGTNQSRLKTPPEPDRAFLSAFAALASPKILLCHHPEYYEPYLAALGLPLILAGHAHGGHWRVFGRGVFAPGQGLFPKYTAGWSGPMLVSRGVSNPLLIPRIFNPEELILLDLSPEK